MRVYRDLTPTTEYTAVALGYFDGVHMGHKEVLSATARCKSEGLTPVAFTFSSTPKANDINSQLSTLEEKYQHLESLGIEILYIIDFEKIREKSPEAFVEEIVKNVFNAKKVFCGFNYHFGKNGAGTTEDLQRLCDEREILLKVSQPVIIDGMVVSSTTIRELLQEGEIQEANRLLGYDYGVVSVSVEGNHIGTLMDTPTINQHFDSNIILPKFGVYASVVTIDNDSHFGVTNIGVKPTIGDNLQPICETWLPLYKGGDLYGKKIDTRLKVFIRPERKFSSIDELESAIKKDGKKAVEILQQEMNSTK
jgi:riboflavin kinase/FMN adenylyltransferase